MSVPELKMEVIRQVGNFSVVAETKQGVVVLMCGSEAYVGVPMDHRWCGREIIPYDEVKEHISSMNSKSLPVPNRYKPNDFKHIGWWINPIHDHDIDESSMPYHERVSLAFRAAMWIALTAEPEPKTPHCGNS